MSPVFLRRLLLPALLVAFLLIVTGQAQPAHAACTPGTVLCDRFGVELKLNPNASGGLYTTQGASGTPLGTGLPYDLTSFVPTNPSPTIDYVVGDWYGRWHIDSISTNTSFPQPGATNNWWPSGSEPYDTEAYYFDNDAENFYLAIVSSVPPYQFIGNGVQQFGVYETRPPFSSSNGFWIPPSDLAIDLRYGQPGGRPEGPTGSPTFWHYDYGLNIVHENRDVFQTVSAGGNNYRSATARNYTLGTDLWKTNTDNAPRSQSNDNPAAGVSDWYTAVGNGAVTAHFEHTNFDPESVRNVTTTPMQFVGNVPVLNWYEYVFPGGQVENDQPTYVLEVVIPRAFFGVDNPPGGRQIAFRYGTACRNDGNSTAASDPMLKLIATVDDLDWGDAPDGPYPTTKASTGANHVLLPTGPFMGALVDAENDGQPNITATGDDINPAGADDEDGVAFVSSLVADATLVNVATITVDMTASPAACTLSSWIDFNISNAWNDPIDQLIYQTCPTCTGFLPGPNPVLPAGQIHTLTFDVPPVAAGLVPGTTYARFRCTTTGALPPTGSAIDGEVEDYQVFVESEGGLGEEGELDWGDAPDSYGTLASSNGPWHLVFSNSPILGATVDTEANGQPTVGADGDDNNGIGPDDEDGVTLPGSVIAGIPANMTVVVSNAPCFLTSWIDFDINGVFDSGEQLNITNCPTCTPAVPPNTTSPQLPVGTHTLTFDVPAGAAPGASYARFRCSNTAQNSPLGGDLTGGEVEDYPITIENEDVDWGDLPATAPGTAFPTLAAANGPRHVMSSNLFLGQCVDAEGNGVPSAQANGDDTATGTVPSGFPVCQTPGDDEDGVVLVTPLVAGNQACVAVTANNAIAGVLQGWIDFDGSGAFDASEALAFAGGGAVPAGPVNQNYCFTVPAGATFFGGQAYMRFRLSSAGGLSWTGAANDGEVEDYAQPMACVGNHVWYDSNGNGLQDEPGSAGINGVAVTLTWFGPDGNLGGGDDVVYTTSTALGGAINGRYQFCGLTNGTYRLDIPNPPYTLATTANAGSNTYLDSDGLQAVSSGPVTTNPFTINNPAGLRTDELGPGDQVGAGTTGIGFSGFPNNQDNMSIDFGFTGTPLSVLLAGFDAASQADHVLVSWETVSEANNAGFNLYRSLTADGEYTLLGFTPSASPGSTQGAAYSYEDYAVTPGQIYWYRLDSVDLNGAVVSHGPVSVLFQAPTAVELNTLAAESDVSSVTLLWLLAALLAAGAAALAIEQRRRRAA